MTKKRPLPAEGKSLCHNPSLTLLAKAVFVLEGEQHHYAFVQRVYACQYYYLIGRVRRLTQRFSTISPYKNRTGEH